VSVLYLLVTATTFSSSCIFPLWWWRRYVSTKRRFLSLQFKSLCLLHNYFRLATVCCEETSSRQADNRHVKLHTADVNVAGMPVRRFIPGHRARTQRFASKAAQRGWDEKRETSGKTQKWNINRWNVGERSISLYWSASSSSYQAYTLVRSEVFTAVTTKNAVFWDIKPQFVLHRR
jgi:hypothetical protein